MNEYIKLSSVEIEYHDGSNEKLNNDTAVLERAFADGYTTVRARICGKQKVRRIRITLSPSFELADMFTVCRGGFNEVYSVKEKTSVRDMFSLVNSDGIGISIMNKLPAKFDSFIVFDGKEICLETVIPFSYEGDVFSESFIISPRTSYTEAYLYAAEINRCADKVWDDVIGWGSWDYYFTSIDEESVRENTDFIYNDEILREKVKYIAIDDGWQQREGDWKEGCRFPNGLAKTVSYINERGFIAGIWTAPTRLHNLCATVMRRNSFLVRNSYGDPAMDEEFYITDPTHPDGESYLREIYTYLKKCGFSFYKIDFISNMLRCDYFYDKNAGPYDALRKLISIIRECVGDDSHIMGCSLPYAYGGDGIDSRRTGLDIHNTWKHVKRCTEIYFPQFASHRRIFQNDLDYLVVRGRDTSENDITNVLNPLEGKYRAEKTDGFRWRDGEDFTYDEAKFWCAMILMSGSSVMLSDRLTKLNEKGLGLLKTTLCNLDFSAATPDVCAELPSVWRKDGFIFVFNFDECEREFLVTTEGEYREIYDGALYSADNGALKVKLKGHSCLALKRMR